MLSVIFGVAGTVSAAVSAYYWIASSRVPPVYNTAVLSGPNPVEKARTDKAAALNSKAAIATAAAVACQAAIFIIGLIEAWNSAGQS